MSRAQRLPTSIVCRAIDWQMRLRDAAGDVDLQHRLQDWLSLDTRHRLAWQRLQEMDGLFQAGPLPAAAQSIPLLNRAEADLSRRRTLKLMGVGLTLGGAGLLATTMPLAWHADLRTATGERRQVELANGARVLLNTCTALDVQGHELFLREGELLVEGGDWTLHCGFAACAGRDASVLLRERDQASEIHVQHGQVLVSGATGARQLRAGEGVRVSASGIAVLGQAPLDPFAWTRGLLVVSDIRLADYLAEVGRYRPGWLRCDESVADLHLSGVFRLDQPDAMLRNITHLLPVRIVERTRWWVTVTAAV